MELRVSDIKERMVERYNKFVQEFKEELKRQKLERLEDVKVALKAAKERMLKTTDATEEELEQIAKTVEKEMRETFGKARDGLKKLEARALERPTYKIMNEARSVLKDISGKVKTAVGELEEGLDKGMVYFTGEKVESGTFACKRCNKEVFMPLPADLPECSDCSGTIFRKKQRNIHASGEL
jgi:DNA anti-recombination protein RmuC